MIKFKNIMRKAGSQGARGSSMGALLAGPPDGPRQREAGVGERDEAMGLPRRVRAAVDAPKAPKARFAPPDAQEAADASPTAEDFALSDELVDSVLGEILLEGDAPAAADERALPGMDEPAEDERSAAGQDAFDARGGQAQQDAEPAERGAGIDMAGTSAAEIAALAARFDDAGGDAGGDAAAGLAVGHGAGADILPATGGGFTGDGSAATAGASAAAGGGEKTEDLDQAFMSEVNRLLSEFGRHSSGEDDAGEGDGGSGGDPALLEAERQALAAITDAAEAARGKALDLVAARNPAAPPPPVARGARAGGGERGAAGIGEDSPGGVEATAEEIDAAFDDATGATVTAEEKEALFPGLDAAAWQESGPAAGAQASPAAEPRSAAGGADMDRLSGEIGRIAADLDRLILQGGADEEQSETGGREAGSARGGAARGEGAAGGPAREEAFSLDDAFSDADPFAGADGLEDESLSGGLAGQVEREVDDALLAVQAPGSGYGAAADDATEVEIDFTASSVGLDEPEPEPLEEAKAETLGADDLLSRVLSDLDRLGPVAKPAYEEEAERPEGPSFVNAPAREAPATEADALDFSQLLAEVQSLPDAAPAAVTFSAPAGPVRAQAGRRDAAHGDAGPVARAGVPVRDDTESKESESGAVFDADFDADELLRDLAGDGEDDGHKGVAEAAEGEMRDEGYGGGSDASADIRRDEDSEGGDDGYSEIGDDDDDDLKALMEREAPTDKESPSGAPAAPGANDAVQLLANLQASMSAAAAQAEKKAADEAARQAASGRSSQEEIIRQDLLERSREVEQKVLDEIFGDDKEEFREDIKTEMARVEMDMRPAHDAASALSAEFSRAGDETPAADKRAPRRALPSPLGSAFDTVRFALVWLAFQMNRPLARHLTPARRRILAIIALGLLTTSFTTLAAALALRWLER